MQISILDALLISVIGIAIVFAVLIILMLIIMLMGVIADKSPAIAAKMPKIKFGKKKAQSAETVEDKHEAPAAVGTCGELVLVKTDERDAAMIMAIVADTLDTPLNQLRFKSIKRVDEGDKE